MNEAEHAAFAGIFFTLVAYLIVFGIGDDTAALMLFVIVGSVYPSPEYPYNILPYVFFADMLMGATWFTVLKLKSPQTLASIQHDMEGD